MMEPLVKQLCIRCLENWWSRLLAKFQNILLSSPGRGAGEDFSSPTTEDPSVYSFLQLWHTIVSVRSNLSVVDTKHFYLQVNSFVPILTSGRIQVN